MLSKALARSIDCSVRRIQFTPDLLPSDVTGVSVFNQNTREFEFRPGGVFANIVVGDEINRASPKTQSALLECMEERQVTVDNNTYQLETPFMVIATQNPIEMEGTYALPEAQRDRFMARVSVGYPVEAAEIAMLNSHTTGVPLDDLEPVTDAAEIRKLSAIVGQVYVSEAVQRYTVALTSATRRSEELTLGASPRATLHLVRASKAMAAMHGRDYVLPDDVHTLARPVLAHRLLPSVEAAMSGRSTTAILDGVLAGVPVPEGTRA
jgi:MoxR-like ATPase